MDIFWSYSSQIDTQNDEDAQSYSSRRLLLDPYLAANGAVVKTSPLAATTQAVFAAKMGLCNSVA